jgi:isoquinoline 1-oxidoreductase beta subunit
MADAPRAPWRLTRRDLLGLGLSATAAGAAGLALGVWGGRKLERRAGRVPPRPEPLNPSVFLTVDHDGTTTIWVTRSEMGQGVATSLPMIVAEELDADWRHIRIEQAPASASFGSQATVASNSIRELYRPLREAGAIARRMLVRAAAAAWQIDESDCETDPGFVVHRPSGRRLGYGALAETAGGLPVPDDAPLKDPRAFRIIGQPTLRLDTAAKIDGRARYGIDVRQPGQLFASIERPPRLGATLRRIDEAAARAVAGVVDVIRDDRSATVVAEHTWAAFAGRRALAAEWTEGDHPDLDTGVLAAQLRARVDTLEGSAVARADGDVEAALSSASRILDATYEVPYLAHACMEPINCTAQRTPEGLTLWAPTQLPQRMQRRAAERAGLPLDAVTLHVTMLGGGFGRRVEDLEVMDAVRVAEHVRPRPVQVVWRREDDLRHDRYRDAAAHRLKVALDGAGRPLAWRHHIATPSRVRSASGEVDALRVEGAREMPYAFDGGVEVRWSNTTSPVPTGIWRSVSHSHTALAVEAMVDEVAQAAGSDPVRFRLDRLGAHPDQAAVLRRVAEACRWDDGAPAGRARGVALHRCYGSICAQVAEVSRDSAGGLRVHKVWAAIDCGRVINPLTVEAQVEGAIVWGLTAALYGRIEHREGRVVQGNFDDYPLLRADEMPEVEVSLVEANRSPSGVGEVAVPPVAPAVVNAAAALDGGTRLRRLPLEAPS